MLVIRHPTKDDGEAMFRIASETPLDTNSEYSYLMMAEFHSSTCVVVEDFGEIVGFCTANIISDPERLFPDTLFIWQIAVLKEYRGQGYSKEMVKHLIEEIKLPYLQCTITKNNKGSISLFRSIAEEYNAEYKTSEGFTEDDFSGDQPAEMLVSIGPFDWR